MKKPHRDKKGRFMNPWTDFRRSTLGVFRWKLLSRNRFRKEKKRPVSFRVIPTDFPGLEAVHGDYVAWLGHSTVFMRAGERRIITDPVFWDVLPFFIKRKTPLPVDPDELPQMDYVLISHTHYDHLNNKSVEFLINKFNPVFITGPGYEGYLRRRGIARHVVLDWWDSHSDGPLRITALPVQHWSKRGFFDTDRMLWSSYMVENGGKKYYWIGDTGYFAGFKEVGEKFGGVDLLLAPIGAYEPRWFMKPYHLNPEEAFEVARDVRAGVFIPIHWGTFDLTDEPLWLPLERLKEVAEGEKNPKLVILEHGGHYRP